MSPIRIIRSIFYRVKLASTVLINPYQGGYRKPEWLSGRETFDLATNTLTGTFRNLYEFEMTGSEREWKQLLFYSEMINKIKDKPGDIAEFGVSGGVSLMAFTRLLNIYEIGFDHKEKKSIYGFDSFSGLPDLNELDTSKFSKNSEMRVGGFEDKVGYKYLLKFINIFDNVHLVKGFFSDSLPVFIKENPSIAFSLVHIDCDLYDSTIDALTNVWDRVVPGGIIVFDELFHKDFPGETEAFKEFFHDKAGTFELHRSYVKPDKKYILKI